MSFRKALDTIVDRSRDGYLVCDATSDGRTVTVIAFIDDGIRGDSEVFCRTPEQATALAKLLREAMTPTETSTTTTLEWADYCHLEPDACPGSGQRLASEMEPPVPCEHLTWFAATRGKGDPEGRWAMYGGFIRYVTSRVIDGPYHVEGVVAVPLVPDPEFVREHCGGPARRRRIVAECPACSKTRRSGNAQGTCEKHREMKP